MNSTDLELQHDNRNPSYFVAGMLLGSLLGALIGALVMLLLAPQSGIKTRKQIQRKGRNLRLKTTDAVGDTADQVRDTAHDITSGIHDQAEALQQRGVDMVDHQKERWSPVLEAGKVAVNGS